MPENESYIALTIAGFDPCGGAGVLADVKTMQQCRVMGMAVQTALTAQNEDKVYQVAWQNLPSIRAQLKALFEKYTFEVVKIGIVHDLKTLNQIIDLLISKNPETKIVWDPILKSSSGFDFLSGLTANELQTILEKVYLITPNLPEYQELQDILGEKAFDTNVLIKGGHTETDDTTDLLQRKDGLVTPITGQRLAGGGKHGTGCVLSAGIVAGLAKGMKLKSACTFAKRYVESYIRSGVNKLGAHYEIEI